MKTEKDSLNMKSVPELNHFFYFSIFYNKKKNLKRVIPNDLKKRTKKF